VKGNEEVGEHFFGIGDFISFLIRVRRCSERREDQVSQMRRRFHSPGGHGRAYEENAVVRFIEETKLTSGGKKKNLKREELPLFPFYF